MSDPSWLTRTMRTHSLCPLNVFTQYLQCARKLKPGHFLWQQKRPAHCNKRPAIATFEEITKRASNIFHLRGIFYTRDDQYVETFNQHAPKIQNLVSYVEQPLLTYLHTYTYMCTSAHDRNLSEGEFSLEYEQWTALSNLKMHVV